MEVEKFSRSVRGELMRLEIAAACCREAELVGVLLCQAAPGGKLVVHGTSLSRRLYQLSREAHPDDLVRLPAEPAGRELRLKRVHSFQLHGSLATWSDGDTGAREAHWKRLITPLEGRPCCTAAVLRALFLAGGSVSAPSGAYHLEVVLPAGLTQELHSSMLYTLGLRFLFFSRRARTVAYLKSGEAIAEFLGHLGAVSAMLLLEDVSISRRLRESINRNVNMEISNLKRSTRSAQAEVDAIRYLESQGLIGMLPIRLQEICRLRMDHPTADLNELAKLGPSSLSRSGIYHRLRAVKRRASEERRLRASTGRQDS